MPHPITLTEKAWNFVESRRGQMTHSDYVNLLIENIEDLSGEGTATIDGGRTIEAIEAFRPVAGHSVGSGADYVSRQIMGYLSEVYHGKVPRKVFEKKCAERGLSPEEIGEAEKEYGKQLV